MSRRVPAAPFLSGIAFMWFLFMFLSKNHNFDKHSMKTLNRSEVIPQPLTEGSPSLVSPMVIVVCDSVGDKGDIRLLSISKNETDDPDFVKRVQESWSRQAEQLTTMLKTLLYFTKSPLWRIIVMTDTRDTFNKVLNLTTVFPGSRLLLQHRPIWLPRDEPVIKGHWRPCAWAKQFMAEALPDQDSAVYVDTDVLFLGPAEELWWLLHSMGPRQALALAPEPQYLLDTPKRPFAGSVGLNTGVMVANLTRLRQLPGGGLGSAILNSGAITPPPRHDQDALNHYLLHRPHLLLEVTSRWNFSPTCCFLEAPPCADCLSAGILVLHGAGTSFFRFIDRKFLVMYTNLSRLRLGDDPRLLLTKVEGHLSLADYWAHIFPCSNHSGLNHALTLRLADAAMATTLKLPPSA
ncbi:hypothetical protein O3P69_018677 [Scylla paramamosain]|uniref:Glucoside xylosyltransferase 1 n=1 Tax=Scylla paramamosain TaxID=85552 RepID=A0AAW0SHU8_SCYPA